jgi:hypothetical protein
VTPCREGVYRGLDNHVGLLPPCGKGKKNACETPWTGSKQERTSFGILMYNSKASTRNILPIEGARPP